MRDDREQDELHRPRSRPREADHAPEEIVGKGQCQPCSLRVVGRWATGRLARAARDGAVIDLAR